LQLNSKQTTRLAAVGDLHVKKTSQGTLQPLLEPVNGRADILLLCGDLTDYGLPEEADILVRELSSAVNIPVVAVLGNHDYESGQHQEVCRILSAAGIKVLDGEAYEIRDIGIAGAKGFSGGFGRATLGAWGEPATKRFVQEAIDEALKFESAVARWKASRSRSSPIWARAGSKSPSIGTPSIWCFMVMRTTDASKGVRARAPRSSMSRCRY
jgi:Icc-related predicted phosphoesterase